MARRARAGQARPGLGPGLWGLWGAVGVVGWLQGLPEATGDHEGCTAAVRPRGPQALQGGHGGPSHANLPMFVAKIMQ